jgi:hypothetical protein
MNFFSKFILSFKNYINIITAKHQLSDVVFYSESNNDFYHFIGLIDELLNQEIKIIYITSDEKDPCLNLSKINLISYYIGDQNILSLIFKKINIPIFISSLPDLGKYHLKKSNNNTHYIYIHHSLVSMHSAYRSKAFNEFDTIFCSGPHHVREYNEICNVYKLKNKRYLKYGYGKIDYYLKKNELNFENRKKNKIILIGPTWGPEALIESGKIYNIIDHLINLNLGVILKPHPETIRHYNYKIKKIIKKYKYSNFIYTEDPNNINLYKSSDYILTDWSGFAYEYFFIFKKPIIFFDTKMKINNADFGLFKSPVFEKYSREEIGIIYDKELNLDEVRFSESNYKNFSPNVFNLNNSNKVGANYIKKILRKY